MYPVTLDVTEPSSSHRGFERAQAQAVACCVHMFMNVAGTMAFGLVEVIPEDQAQGRFPVNVDGACTHRRRSMWLSSRF
jgi:hypothetical protein